MNFTFSSRDKYSRACAEVDYATAWPDLAPYGKAEKFDLVLADIDMKPMDGITLLKQLKQYDPGAVIIIMTAYASTESAIARLRGLWYCSQSRSRTNASTRVFSSATVVVESVGSAIAGPCSPAPRHAIFTVTK